jgi:hypothetical protein
MGVKKKRVSAWRKERHNESGVDRRSVLPDQPIIFKKIVLAFRRVKGMARNARTILGKKRERSAAELKVTPHPGEEAKEKRCLYLATLYAAAAADIKSSKIAYTPNKFHVMSAGAARTATHPHNED